MIPCLNFGGIMGSETKLYINNQKYTANDVLNIMTKVVREKYCEQNLMLKYENGGNYFTINYTEKIRDKVENRTLSLFLNINSIGLPAHMLSLNASGDSINLLKTIGEMLGGVFTANDFKENYEVFQDPFISNEDFMLKETQIKGK